MHNCTLLSIEHFRNLWQLAPSSPTVLYHRCNPRLGDVGVAAGLSVVSGSYACNCDPASNTWRAPPCGDLMVATHSSESRGQRTGWKIHGQPKPSPSPRLCCVVVVVSATLALMRRRRHSRGFEPKKPPTLQALLRRHQATRIC